MTYASPTLRIRQLRHRHPSDRGGLGQIHGADGSRLPPVRQDRRDQEAGDAQEQVRQQRDRQHRSRIEAGLLGALAQRGTDGILVTVLLPAGKRRLAGVGAQRRCPCREEQVGAVDAIGEQHQHGTAPTDGRGDAQWAGQQLLHGGTVDTGHHRHQPCRELIVGHQTCPGAAELAPRHFRWGHPWSASPTKVEQMRPLLTDHQLFGDLRLDGSGAVGRAQLGQEAGTAGRLLGVTDPAAVVDGLIGETGPPGTGEHRVQLQFDANGIRLAGQTPAPHQSADMRVHSDARNAESVTQHHVGGLPTDARQGHEIIEPTGELTVEPLQQRPTEPDQ